jgi:tRNA threonylcarbamoyladenosine biosynthesis protein TsaB
MGCVDVKTGAGLAFPRFRLIVHAKSVQGLFRKVSVLNAFFDVATELTSPIPELGILNLDHERMAILGLETSGMGGGAAVVTDDGRTFAVRLPAGAKSAPGLAPAIRDALSAAGLRPADIRVVGVTVGPGSFTGLRIGVTTAKTLAYSLSADLVAVDTLDVVARQAPLDGDRLHAVLDAHRGQLFAGRYVRNSGIWRADGPWHLPTIDEWLGALAPGDLVSGPIVGRISARLPADVRAVEEQHRMPDAATVARLAAELHAAGRRDDVWKLVPNYGRLAAAEEKRQANPTPAPNEKAANDKP